MTNLPLELISILNLMRINFFIRQAQGTCEVLPIAQAYFQAQTQLRTYDTRYSHDALIIDALIGALIFAALH